MRLQSVYGSAAYCRVSVFKWISKVRRGNEERPGICYQHETDAAIGPILQEDANASLRTITETLTTSSETVRTYMSRIGYTPKTLRWIFHALTCELKQVRLTQCLQLLSKLRGHTRQLAASRHGGRMLVLLRVCSRSNGQQGMKTQMKPKTGPVRPEKYAVRCMECPRVPCYYNASSENLI
jgi:hypothetical protein